MAVNDTNQAARLMKLKEAEATWPDNLKYLCRYFAGVAHSEAAKDIFTTPKSIDDLVVDVYTKLTFFGFPMVEKEVMPKISETVYVHLEHYKLEELVLSSKSAYSSTVERMAMLIGYSMNCELFSKKFGVEVDPPEQTEDEAFLINGGAAAVTETQTAGQTKGRVVEESATGSVKIKQQGNRDSGEQREQRRGEHRNR